MLHNKIRYDFDQIALDAQLKTDAGVTLKPVLQQIRSAVDDTQYSTSYASVRLPFDAPMLQAVEARVKDIGPIDHVVVIGIGGSSLGFKAVYDALQDQASMPSRSIIVLETVDTPSVVAALKHIDYVLTQKLRVHVCVISKSGTTTETITLWRMVQPVLQEHAAHQWHIGVTIITDAGSVLEQYAHDHKIAVLHIPPLVGGRYSVLSSVGLFPLMLCGIDGDVVHAGARDALTDATTLPLQDTFPFKHACALQAAYNNCYEVHDTFIFSPWCATLGLWYRQLAAESLGKMSTVEDMIVDMIPTVSIGSTDLHSIGQLYLSGAQNFWTTFLIVHEHNVIKTNDDHALDRCVQSLNNRSLNAIMSAIIQGTMAAYQERGVPFSVVTLPERSPYAIGYLLQSYMLAIIYAGELLGVNPFDQPDVERYKSITRTLLDQ